VVIAVVAVLMMQVATNEIVHMIAMRHTFVSAIVSVLMPVIVRLALVPRCTGGRVLRRHGNIVLLNTSAALMVQVSVMQVVSVPFVLNGRMSATRVV
jgi:hypothetical protein